MDHIFISVVAVGSPMRSASPFNLKFAYFAVFANEML